MILLRGGETEGHAKGRLISTHNQLTKVLIFLPAAVSSLFLRVGRLVINALYICTCSTPINGKRTEYPKALIGRRGT